MTLRGSWVPRNDTEEEMLYAVLDLAKAAHDDGVPPTRIAGLCGFACLSVLNEANDAPTDAETAHAPPDAEKDVVTDQPCPECGSEITEVIMDLGGVARVDHPDGSFCEGISVDEHPFLEEVWKQDRHGL